jgi:two-component system, LytTR family, sensor kinase
MIHHSPVTRNIQPQNVPAPNAELFRSLLQPHFLFNSLNNLYALSLKQSDSTPDAIAGLSRLLEMVVRYSRKESIPLSDEVSLIEDYILLEKIWLGEFAFSIDFQVQGDTAGVTIPPLTIFTLIENAFKHGIRKCGKGGWITILLSVKGSMILMKVRNSMDTRDGDQLCQKNARNGMGIEAVKKILDTSYRKAYYLDARPIGNVYAVDLIIGRVAA